MHPLLELHNVTKYYGSGDAVSKALNGVSFTMERGEFTAIMGASGSGKSTLLNVIATIDRPSSGSIVLEGRDAANLRERSWPPSAATAWASSSRSITSWTPSRWGRTSPCP